MLIELRDPTMLILKVTQYEVVNFMKLSNQKLNTHFTIELESPTE